MGRLTRSELTGLPGQEAKKITQSWWLMLVMQRIVVFCFLHVYIDSWKTWIQIVGQVEFLSLMVFFQNEKLGHMIFQKIISNKLPRAEISSFPIIENNVISKWYKINFWHFDEKSMYRWSSPMRTFVHFIHPFPLKGQIPDAILTKPRRFQRAVRFSPFYFFWVHVY